MNIKPYLVLTAFLWLSACTPSKKLTSENRFYSREEIIEALREHNQDFSWFHGKASVAIRTSAESRDVQMVLRMARDSAVWVLFKKFEVEAVRVLITPQNYTVLYRMDSAFETAPLYKIREMAGLDVGFNDMQEWIFGNIVLPESDSFIVRQERDFIRVEFESGPWQLSYDLNAKNLRLKTAVLRDDKNRALRFEYDDYKKTKNKQVLAHTRAIFFPEQPGVQGEIRFDFSEMELNTPKELKFVVPSHYREIE
jgi:hypothetical protein